VVRISGPDLAERLPVDDTQRRLASTPGTPGARYEIAREALEGEALPPTAPPTPEHLASDAFVQATHPRLRAAAAEILAGADQDFDQDAAQDDWVRALVLTDWVFENVDKVPTLGIPSALDVLEHRRGDCNEHTVLYTALARAAGIPTRIAIGLVWSDDLEGFYYHAWPEVFAGGRWTWTDPTLGQHGADATHLKLLEGGVESWPQLLPFLGKLEVHVETVR
ncbi:MAG TPA: transglutaminase-like domain-containing protein, partial [Thermoanaerobaculia bacterium]|nr:transglutaminase-like domain-containing protein [Thermoanaerobaculia bacterium]